MPRLSQPTVGLMFIAALPPSYGRDVKVVFPLAALVSAAMISTNRTRPSTLTGFRWPRLLPAPVTFTYARKP
jgi:hypothetical protein